MRVGRCAILLAAGLAVHAAAAFVLDSGTLVITEGVSVAGRTAAELRTAVTLNLHLLAFVAAAHGPKFGPGAAATVNLTVGTDGVVTASRMVETTVSDSAANGALVRSMLRWRFASSPGSSGPVAFSFRVTYHEQGLPGSARAAAAAPAAAPRPVPAQAPREQARTRAAAMATRRPESSLTPYDRQRAGTTIGVLGGVSLGTALLAVGSFALGAAFESGGNGEAETAFNVIGGCLAGASGICLGSGAAVGIRLSVKARKGATTTLLPGVELALEF